MGVRMAVTVSVPVVVKQEETDDVGEEAQGANDHN